MANLSYIVETEFKTTGDPSSGLANKAKKTESLWSNLGKKVSGYMSSIGSKLVSLGVDATKFGIAAGIGAATYGVYDLNNKLEVTKMSLAAIFNAQGVSPNIENGLRRAGKLVEKMRTNANELPGEFSDLVGIFQSGINSALNSGLTATTFEKMSAQAMAAGAAMTLPLDMVGRELSQLLQGRAGAHNVFGSQLGIHAQGFNDKTASERAKIIAEQLKKYEPAIVAFGKTFDAIWSTSISNGKQFLQIATEPLFESAKDTLSEINTWFTANKGDIIQWGKDLGKSLKEGFLQGKEFVKEWGPPALKFVKTLEGGFSTFLYVVKTIGHYLDKWLNVSERFKRFLNDEGAFRKLLPFIVALGANGILGKIGGPVGGAGQKVLGQGMAGFAAGQVVGGLIDHFVDAKSEANKDIFASLLSKMGAGAAMGSAFGPIGTAVGALGGAGLAVYEHSNDVEAARQKAAQAMVNSFIKTKDQWDPISLSYTKTVERIDTDSQQFQMELHKLADEMGDAAVKMAKFDADFHNASVGDSNKVNQSILITKKMIDDADITHKPGLIAEMARQQTAIAAENQRIEDEKHDKFVAAAKKDLEGKSVMNIAKVEITVSSNQAPDQIARAVFGKLSGMKRAPIRDGRVPNYSRSQ